MSKAKVIKFIDKYDLVIHAAGKIPYIPKTNEDEKLFFNINVNGTRNLLDSLTLNAILKYFVFISLVSVYGLTEGNLIHENAKLNADDPYGKSKVIAENIVQASCNNSNVICTILRLPLIVGPNPPGNLGMMINGI